MLFSAQVRSPPVKALAKNSRERRESNVLKKLAMTTPSVFGKLSQASAPALFNIQTPRSTDFAYPQTNAI